MCCTLHSKWWVFTSFHISLFPSFSWSVFSPGHWFLPVVILNTPNPSIQTFSALTRLAAVYFGCLSEKRRSPGCCEGLVFFPFFFAHHLSPLKSVPSPMTACPSHSNALYYTSPHFCCCPPLWSLCFYASQILVPSSHRNYDQIHLILGNWLVPQIAPILPPHMPHSIPHDILRAVVKKRFFSTVLFFVFLTLTFDSLLTASFVWLHFIYRLYVE